MRGRVGEISVGPSVSEEVVVVSSVIVVAVSATDGFVEVESEEDEDIDEDGSLFFPFSTTLVSFIFDL